MKLENQVVPIEQAKRLKELGVIQKSLFYHHKYFKRPVFGEYYTGKYNKHDMEIQVCNDKENAVSAFTVAELGVMLPSELPSSEELIKMLLLQCEKPWYENDLYSCHYIEVDYSYDIGSHIHTNVGTTEAIARAAMLIYLLENNLTTADEVNERLKNA